VPGTGVDVSHHDLGFSGVSQQRDTAGLFDFVDDPVVVANRLQGDRSFFRESGKELEDRARLVIDAGLFHG
jgi:hypothetical protein